MIDHPRVRTACKGVTGYLAGLILMGAIGFVPPAPAAPQKPPLEVCIIWHQHQPRYPKEPGTNIYAMPWVRLHAAKDYVDMAAIAERYEGLKLTFNLTPVLLEQVIDYTRGATDRAMLLSQRHAAALSDDDKRYLDKHFFSVSEPMLKRFPAYAALKAKPRDRYTLQDWRDLQVWFNLAWLDPDVLATPPFSKMQSQGSGFSENQKQVVLNKHRSMLAEIIPLHRRLQQKGLIEVSTTPFFHPILPLVHDSDLADEALPGASKPARRFQAPDDAREHVALAVEQYKQLFARAPRGMWPGEGSVAQAVAPYFKDNGIRWIASDEEVLGNSLKIPMRSGEKLARPDLLYRPYQVAGGPAILFRDRKLSDDIGFRYGKMRGKDAAADLLGQLKAIHGKANAPSLVTLILDGENAWENYPDDGKEFFHTLYAGLTTKPWVKTVTPSEAIATRKPAPLAKLWAGSWIQADFSTWIGEEEENRAWEMLADARQALTAHRTRKGEDARYRNARRLLMAAEGSDWFWWYGKDQDSGRDDEFDEAYRMLLGDVYRALGLKPPLSLSIPLVQMGTAADREPSGFVRPTVDGQREALWDNGGMVQSTGGVMQKARLLERLEYGWDGDRLSFMGSFAKEAAPFQLHIGVVGRGGGLQRAGLPFMSHYMVDLGTAGSVLRSLGSRPQSTPVQVASKGQLIEWSIPWDGLDLAGGEELAVAVLHGAEAFPVAPLKIASPPPRGKTIARLVDEQNDAKGHGKLVPPTKYHPANFDLHQAEVSDAGDRWIFSFWMGRVDNPWDSPIGLSLPTIDLYLSRNSEAGVPMTLLPGRQASADRAWDAAISIEGWQSALYRAGGHRVGPLYPVVDRFGKRIAVAVPKHLLKGEPANWSYLVTVAGQDGFAAGRVRALSPVPDPERFVGEGSPIVDLWGSNGDQAKWLAPGANVVLPFKRPTQDPIAPRFDRLDRHQ